MKTIELYRFLPALKVSAWVFILSLTFSPTGFAAGDEQHLRGSWHATVIAETPPGIAPFSSLQTFIPSGEVIESRRMYLAETPFGPLLESVGHGQWLRTGNREFTVVFSFLMQGAPNNPMHAGQTIGTDNIKLQIRMNHAGDHFSGSFVSKIKDLNGQVLFSATGAVEGVPIRVDTWE